MGGKFKLGETQTHLSKKLLRDHPNEEAQGAKENIPGSYRTRLALSSHLSPKVIVTSGKKHFSSSDTHTRLGRSFSFRHNFLN